VSTAATPFGNIPSAILVETSFEVDPIAPFVWLPTRQRLINVASLEAIAVVTWPQQVLSPCMTASALSILFFARISGKERKESHWCGERSQGRRFLAFISTLDTGLHTFTIDPRTKVRVLF
jgi:hypothetical protein